MTPTLTAWLLSTAAIGALLSIVPARIYAAIAFAAMVAATYHTAQIPLGYADYSAPAKGKYTVLGARIDVGVAIYALLDNGKGEPHLYRLPYTESDAKDLQESMDMQFGGQGGGIQAEIGAAGDAAFHAAPVTGEQDKVPETAIMNPTTGIGE